MSYLGNSNSAQHRKQNLFLSKLTPPSGPQAVSAFDFETGAVDLADPGRVVNIVGGFDGSSVLHPANGVQSGAGTFGGFFYMGADADFGVGLGAFGIEFWCWPDAIGGASNVFLFNLGGVFYVRWTAGGGFSLNNQLTSGFIGALIPSNPALDDSLVHVYVGRDALFNMYLAINGVMVAGVPFASSDTQTDVGASAALGFGNFVPAAAPDVFSGPVFYDRIRFYKGVCPYTANFVPQTNLYPP